MKYVLSLDGGGMRGVIPSYILRKIEIEFGRSIPDMFDLIAGTSTGGIMALALTMPDIKGKAKYSSFDLINMYNHHGKKIFNKRLLTGLTSMFSPKYKNDGLKLVLNDYLGGQKFSKCLTRVMITSYDTQIATPVIFKSWRPNHNYLAKDIALATSAAPTFFPPHKLDQMSLIDGGVAANNPGTCAYVEALKLWPNERIKVLSFSTGGNNPCIDYFKATTMGLIEWAKVAVDIVMDGGLDLVDYQLSQILDKDYLRVSPSYMGKISLDDASIDSLVKMARIADKINFAPIVKFLEGA